MKRILRSIINFDDGVNSPDQQLASFQRLKDKPITWVRPDEDKLFKFVQDFVQANQGEVPSAITVRDYFEKTGDQAAIERLGDIAKTPCYTGANFRHLLDELVSQQNEAVFQSILKSALEISSRGLTVEEDKHQVRFQGIRDALSYIHDKAYDLIPSASNAEVRGDVRDDTERAWLEYQDAKINHGSIGKLMGIDYIDEACRGHRPGELWIHAGFPGELKTTLALNWCYNLVTKYRTNVMFCSLEMKMNQLRRSAYTLHTANKKFKRQGKVPPDFRGLDYRKIRDGELSETEEQFYRHALDDFNNDPEHCKFKIWCPIEDVTIDDIRTEAEITHRQMELGFLVIDHGLLVKSDSNSRDYVVQMNSVVRKAKQLALHFNNGQGIPVLLLFQINRQGKALAEKANGEYTMAALTYANECEKSADVITTTYLSPELRQQGRTVLTNLKNRDNGVFPLCELGVDFTSRKLYGLSLAQRSAGGGIGMDEPDEELLNATL